MDKNNDQKRFGLGDRRIGSLVGNHSIFRIGGRKNYSENSRPKAMILVDAILQRGNAVRMVNVGGEFVVTELVVS